ncbi:MAG: chemotaxis protein CheW [Acidobacteriota bacterium]
MTPGKAGAAGEHRYLLIEAGDDRCILPLDRVRRIVRELQVTPLPGASNELKGLAEFGGEPLPVLDFPRVIGAAPGPNPAYPVTVIAWAGPEGARELVGLQVDAVLEVVSVAADAIVSGGEGIVRGDVSLRDRPVRVISLSALGSGP